MPASETKPDGSGQVSTREGRQVPGRAGLLKSVFAGLGVAALALSIAYLVSGDTLQFVVFGVMAVAYAVNAIVWRAISNRGRTVAEGR